MTWRCWLPVTTRSSHTAPSASGRRCWLGAGPSSRARRPSPRRAGSSGRLGWGQGPRTLQAGCGLRPARRGPGARAEPAARRSLGSSAWSAHSSQSSILGPDCGDKIWWFYWNLWSLWSFVDVSKNPNIYPLWNINEAEVQTLFVVIVMLRL